MYNQDHTISRAVSGNNYYYSNYYCINYCMCTIEAYINLAGEHGQCVINYIY